MLEAPLVHYVSRYEEIVAEFGALINCLNQPLSSCIQTNLLKTDADGLRQWLMTQGLDWQSSGWCPGVFQVSGWEKPGRSLPYQCGWYGVQEEIAMTAVELMAPQPGDRVLDLCAAPGGKMAQLAQAVGETGLVVANERSLSRLSALWSTVTRLGLTNVITTHSDGREFAAPAHSFDRVLVDAPCSGEGTIRKKVRAEMSPQQWDQVLQKNAWNPRESQRLVTIQQRLLDRALSLVKPGGVVVYSTCTFAPEENEAVLAAVVGDRGRIEPWALPGLRSDPGLTRWQGQTFRGDMVHAHRYWPHLNDTGGFFAARIRRTDRDMAADTAAAGMKIGDDSPIQPVNNREAIAGMSDRFGIPMEQLEPYRLWTTGQEKVWIAPPQVQPLAQMCPHTIGLPFVRLTNHGFKPTTAALQRWGDRITQHVINLAPDQCRSFLQGIPLPHAPGETATGFVHVRSGRFELGCGRLKGGMLYCELPKFLRSPP